STERVRIGHVVPGTRPVPLPFDVGAHHRFVMGGPDDDAVLVGQSGVQGVVVGEGLTPHRRPQIVALQAQDELEDLHVELVIEVPEGFVYPSEQGWILVVEEDAPVLDGRRAGSGSPRPKIQIGPLWYRYVGPPRPR